MSESSFTFDDILAEATKGRQKDADGNAVRVRLNGTYRLRAAYAAGDKLTAKGDHKVIIAWEVEGGPQAGETTWQNIAFTAKSKGIAGRTIMSMGFPPEYLSSLARSGDFTSGLLTLAEDIVGIVVDMKVEPSVDFEAYEVLNVITGPNIDGPSAPSVAYTPNIVSAPSGLQSTPPVVAHSGGFVPQV